MLLKKQAFPIKGISEHQLIFCGFGACTEIEMTYITPKHLYIIKIIHLTYLNFSYSIHAPKLK